MSSNAKKKKKKKMVVKVKRQRLEACMKCPLCHKLFDEATTISLCLHTFCRKCIYEKLSDEELDCCPVCNIDLGCQPTEKLRPDHNLQDIRTTIFNASPPAVDLGALDRLLKDSNIVTTLHEADPFDALDLSFQKSAEATYAFAFIKDLPQFRAEIAKLSQDNESLLASVRRLEKEKASLTSNLSETLQRENAASDEREALKTRLSSLESELDTSKDLLAKAETCCAQLRTQQESLEEKCSSLSQAVDRQGVELQELKVTLSEKDQALPTAQDADSRGKELEEDLQKEKFESARLVQGPLLRRDFLLKHYQPTADLKS